MCKDCIELGIRKWDEQGRPICSRCGLPILVKTYIDAGHAMSHTDCFLSSSHHVRVVPVYVYDDNPTNLAWSRRTVGFRSECSTCGAKSVVVHNPIDARWAPVTHDEPDAA